MFFSTDNGSNWNALNNGISNLSIKTIVKKDDRLYLGTDGGGLFYSDNEGSAWAQNNTGISSWFIFKSILIFSVDRYDFLVIHLSLF